MVKPALAQSIPTPSVSDLTVQTIHTNDSNNFVITIDNRPFTSYKNGANLYYNLRFKLNSWVEWIYYPLAPSSGYINASQSDFTVVSIPPTILTPNYPTGTQVDFQLQVLIGHDEAHYSASGLWTGNQFTGESSDWSNTQTLTITEIPTSTTPSPNPTPTSIPNYGPTSSPTPTVPELSWLVVLSLFAVMLFVAVKLRHQKTIQSRNFDLA